jgi:hypothetical protein
MLLDFKRNEWRNMRHFSWNNLHRKRVEIGTPDKSNSLPLNSSLRWNFTLYVVRCCYISLIHINREIIWNGVTRQGCVSIEDNPHWVLLTPWNKMAFWEANRRSSNDSPRFLKQKFNGHVHKRSPLAPILSESNPVHTLTICFKLNVIIIVLQEIVSLQNFKQIFCTYF